MSVLETFSILFKSNASDVKKDMGEAEKATQNFQEKINTADKTVSSIGLGLLELGVSAVAGFAAFEGLKNGISNAIDMNAQLERMHVLTGASASELSALEQVFSGITENKGELLSWYNSYVQQQSKLGNFENVKNAIPNLLSFAKEIARLDEASAHTRFSQIQAVTGLPDDFFVVFRKEGEVLNESIEKRKALNNVTEKGTSDAVEFNQQIKIMSDVLGGLFTSIANYLEKITLPILKWLNNGGFSQKGGLLDFSAKQQEPIEHLFTKSDPIIRGSNKNSKLISQDDFGKGIMISSNENPTPMGATSLGLNQNLMNSDDVKLFAKSIEYMDRGKFNMAGQIDTISQPKSFTMGDLIVHTQSSDPKAVAKEISKMIEDNYSLANYHFQTSIDR